MNSDGDREAARSLVQGWFRQVRPSLMNAGVGDDEMSAIDGPMQDILRLAGGRNRRSSYLADVDAARKALGPLEFRREVALSAAKPSTEVRLSSVEQQILSTLDRLVPSAALSYQQASLDLVDEQHISFRGTANELRAVLWDVLDRLAPDSDVVAASGFKLEKGATKPTQKQKARYILRSRKVPEGARKAPETAVELVEAHVGSLARAVYDRSSISSHIQQARAEVVQLKMYVDSVLAELLEIHDQP